MSESHTLHPSAVPVVKGSLKMSDVYLTFDELLGLDETWNFDILDPCHRPSIRFLYRAWCSVVFLLASSPATRG